MARLLVNKKIWIVGRYDGIPFQTDSMIVTGIKQFLPADGERRLQSLLDLWTDGGRRVVAVANIWTKDPNKAQSPW